MARLGRRGWRRGLAHGLLLAAAGPAWGAVAPIGTVMVGKTPGPIAVNPSAHLAYVGNRGDNSVSVINTVNLSVRATLPVGGAPAALAADPPIDMVYAAIPGNGTVAAIAGLAAPAIWPVGGAPRYLAVDDVLNRLYVADIAHNQVHILNALTGAPVRVVPVGGTPSGMAVDVAAHIVFVATTGASGAVVAINGATGSVLKVVGGLPVGLTSIAVNPSNTVVGAVSPSANSLSVIAGNQDYAVATGTVDLGCPTAVVGCTIAGDPNVSTFGPGIDSFFQNDKGDVFYSDATYGFGLADYYGLHVGLGGAHDSGVGFGSCIALAVNVGAGELAGVCEAGAVVIDVGMSGFSSQAYHVLATGAGSTALAFDTLANRLLVTNSGDNSVSVFSTRPDAPTAAFQALNADNIAYNSIDTNPATGKVYTLRLGNLYAIDEAKTGAAAGGAGNNTAGVTAIPLGSVYSSSVAVNPATDKIYVGDESHVYGGGFYSVNGATNVATPVAAMPANTDVRSLAVDTGGNQVVAWDYENENLLILNSTTDKVRATIPVRGNSSLPIYVDAANARAYAVGDYAIVAINLATATVAATIALPGGTECSGFNATLGRIYVGTTSRQVLVIDTRSNAVVKTLTLPYYPELIGTDPISGKYYINSFDNTGPGPQLQHLSIYSGAIDKLIVDYSSKTSKLVTLGSSFVADPLTDTVYMGTATGTSTQAMLAIDGHTDTISAVAPSAAEYNAYALAFDRGTGVLAGAGYSVTGLWFPTSLVGGGGLLPIRVAATGVVDAATLARNPIFRTRASGPAFAVTASNTATGPGATTAPREAFFQVDFWQGQWTPLALAADTGASAKGKITLSALRPGLHVLYTFAVGGDAATTQSDVGGGNSPAVGPITATVFTVER